MRERSQSIVQRKCSTDTMRRIALICIYALLHAAGVIGQDFTFSQFHEQPMLRNPALAGVFTGEFRMTAIHRTQWASVTIPYETSALGLEYKLPMSGQKDFMTIGLQTVMDVAGDVRLKRSMIYPVLNYHKSLDESSNTYLSLAFMGGRVTTQFDPTKATLDDQFVNGSFSPSNPTNQIFSSTATGYWDLSTGMSLSSTLGQRGGNWYMGAAWFHVNRPRVQFLNQNEGYQVTDRWMANIGISLPLQAHTRIQAYADFMRQGGQQQLFVGGMYQIAGANWEDDPSWVFSVGSFYRWKDAIVPTVKIDLPSISFGVSYDVNISSLSVASGYRGGLEITAQYRGFLSNQNKDLMKMRCVRF